MSSADKTVPWKGLDDCFEWRKTFSVDFVIDTVMVRF